jgi:protein-disulfide isomerase
MRGVLLALCGGLVIVGGLFAATVTSPRHYATAAAATGDRGNLGKSIRDYLMANPEVLVEAMQELERRQDSQRDAIAQKGVSENQAELYKDPDSPVGGNPNGDVVVVEFNDYQCPYCKRAYQALKSVAGADGRVKIVYKDIPILGEASKVAALAALAAARQNKHGALHSALMEYSGKLDQDKIFEIAAGVGLDRALLEKDMADPKLKQIIDRNMMLASALGVRGTPAFVIGKQFVPGAIDADALRQLIADARKSMG